MRVWPHTTPHLEEPPQAGVSKDGPSKSCTTQTLLPAPLPSIPRKQQIGEAVIAEARHRPHHGIAEQRREPALAGRRAPDRDRDIGADDQPPRFVGRMQPAPYIIERRAVSGE